MGEVPKSPWTTLPKKTKYWTGRGSVTKINWYELTKKQLNEWGCKYHELRMGKPYYDLFIDDKNLNVKDLHNYINRSYHFWVKNQIFYYPFEKSQNFRWLPLASVGFRWLPVGFRRLPSAYIGLHRLPLASFRRSNCTQN